MLEGMKGGEAREGKDFMRGRTNGRSDLAERQTDIQTDRGTMEYSAGQEGNAARTTQRRLRWRVFPWRSRACFRDVRVAAE